MKNFSDAIGKRTRDLPTCSAVPQPTALPCAPCCVRCMYGKGTGRTMAQTVNSRPDAAATWVRSQASPCGIYGGHSVIWAEYATSSSLFPLSFSFHQHPLFVTPSITDAA